MKTKISNLAGLIISILAMAFASSACMLWLHQPKVPKSLHK